jgi:hypothetical protein
VIEGARSSRAKCKTCRRAIEKGTLRIGLLIEGPYGTGYLWHHLRCAARRQFDRVEEAYAQAAWAAAKEPPTQVPPLEELRGLRDAAEEQRRTRKRLPYLEAAPTGRAACKHCEQPIEKGSLRVVIGRGVHFGSQVRTTPINVHPACAAAALGAEDCTTAKDGFAEALRANSEGVAPERVEATLAEIGTIG